MSKARRQIGAIPFERRPDGTLDVLLVTSRETRRWVVPKGWPMKGRRSFEAAAQEAFEEAGVRGRVGRKELGRYVYPKRLANGDSVTCEVRLFPLHVEHLAETWPEQGQRERQWFPTAEAAEHVQEPGLREILRKLPRQVEDIGKKRSGRKAPRASKRDERGGKAAASS